MKNLKISFKVTNIILNNIKNKFLVYYKTIKNFFFVYEPNNDKATLNYIEKYFNSIEKINKNFKTYIFNFDDFLEKKVKNR